MKSRNLYNAFCCISVLLYIEILISIIVGVINNAHKVYSFYLGRGFLELLICIVYVALAIKMKKIEHKERLSKNYVGVVGIYILISIMSVFAIVYEIIYPKAGALVIMLLVLGFTMMHVIKGGVERGEDD